MKICKPTIQERASQYGAYIIAKSTSNNNYWFILSCGHIKRYDIAKLPLGCKCRTCQTNGYKIRAYIVGCEFMGYTDDYRVNEYKLPCGHIHSLSPRKIKSGKFICPTCGYNHQLAIKHDKECRNAGVQYMGMERGEYIHKGMHVFCKLPCGHQIDMNLTNIRQHKINCPICLENTFKTRINNTKSLTYIGESANGDAHYRQVKCNNGHVYDVQMSVVHDGYVCEKCRSEQQHKKYISEALAHGLEYLGNSTNGKQGQKSYKFIACGHKQDIQTNMVRTGVFKCQQCFDDEIAEAVKVNHLEYLPDYAPTTTAHHRWFKCTQCGEIQQIRIRNAKNGGFCCAGCEDSGWNKPSLHYTLLMTDTTTNKQWLKLGVAQNVNNRIAKYGLTDNIKVEILYTTILMADRFESQTLIESPIAELCKDYHLSPTEVAQYFTLSGQTECYDIACLPLVEQFYHDNQLL